MLAMKMKAYRPPQTPGSYSFDTRLSGTVKQFLAVKDSTAMTWYFERLRLRLSRCFDTAFTGDVPAVLKSITMGDQHGVSDVVRENFRATGLTHLLSISGTHFGMLTALVFWMCNLIICLLPYDFLLKMTLRISTRQAAAL